MNQDDIRQISNLIKTMRLLRSKNGCPWDRGQTPESLKPYILEEAYELVDAIDSGDIREILSELGDLLFQVVFQAQIYSERGLFGLGEIAEGVDLKLQRRHPQIFCSDLELQKFPDWEQIKQQELKERGKPTDFATRQPKNLPALKLADKCHAHLNKRMKSVQPLQNSKEQKQSPTKQISEEMIAKSIFTLVGQAQAHGIDCELALRQYVLQLLQKENQNG